MTLAGFLDQRESTRIRGAPNATYAGESYILCVGHMTLVIGNDHRTGGEGYLGFIEGNEVSRAALPLPAWVVGISHLRLSRGLPA